MAEPGEMGLSGLRLAYRMFQVLWICAVNRTCMATGCRVTTIAAADELAAAASLVMGQAGEGTPVIHARGFPYPLRPARLSELIRDKEMDLFR